MKRTIKDNSYKFDWLNGNSILPCHKCVSSLKYFFPNSRESYAYLHTILQVRIGNYLKANKCHFPLCSAKRKGLTAIVQTKSKSHVFRISSACAHVQSRRWRADTGCAVTALCLS